jgi:hypothetical protein
MKLFRGEGSALLYIYIYICIYSRKNLAGKLLNMTQPRRETYQAYIYIYIYIII